MDCILNELSLSGQFKDISDFSENGIKDIVEILRNIRNLGITLYKKSDFCGRKVSASMNFYDVIISRESRTNDVIRKVKSLLSTLQTEPFWDMNGRQDPDKSYVWWDDKKKCFRDISGSSIAEAYARDTFLISFKNSIFSENNFRVILLSGENNDVVKNISNDEKLTKEDKSKRISEVLRNISDEEENNAKEIDNITDDKRLLELAFREGKISTESFFKGAFCHNLDFSSISDKNGFELVTNQNLSLFMSAFEKFDRLSWPEILKDNGFEFKEFSQNKDTKSFFSDKLWKLGIYKIRIDKKTRCFGYCSSKKFHVLRFDLDHKLSDMG